MKSLNPFRIACMLAHPATRPLFAIPTHLTDRERFKLLSLAKGRERAAGRPVQVVEIGAYLGASTCFLASGLQRSGSRVLSVDTWSNDAMTEGPRDTMSQFLGNTKDFGDRVVAIRGWSHDPDTLDRVRAAAGAIDLLFIDGDHGFEGVLRDWETYSPMLADGAVVVMHDFGWAEGVQEVVATKVRPATTGHAWLRNLWWGTVSR